MTIRRVHEGDLTPNPRYQKRDREWFIGRCVKIAFESNKGDVEWMWVLVNRIDGNTLFGTLDNEPLYCTHLAYGETIALSRLQIAAVDLTIEEWREEVNELKAKGDYFNRFLGSPLQNSGFEQFFAESFTPTQALNRWVKWLPSENESLQFLVDIANSRA